MRLTITSMVCTLALLGFGLDGSRVIAQEKLKGEKTYAPTPWHLVDIWWDLGKDTPFQSYSIDVTIDRDIPTTTALYIAPLGLGQFGDTSFYGGIQTQTDGNTKKDRELRQLGPGYLFSMWGERGYDAIRPSEGGFCQSSGHEGDFVSVRRPHLWSKGTYTYRITRMDEEEVNGKLCTWVCAFVCSHEKDENVFIGALRFPSKDLVLSRKVASFVEIYGQRIPVAEIPQATLTFGKLVVNGKPVKVASAEAVYPDGVPDYAGTEAREDQLVVNLGKSIENRTRRTVRLIPAENGKR